MYSAGHAGVVLLWIGLVSAIVTMAGYGLALARPRCRKTLWASRIAYLVTAASVLGTFGVLAALIYTRQYQYHYVFEHTGNDLHGWFRLAATWAGQEGSFLLWASWTSIIGIMVFSRAGKYEARVMPFYTSILAFLCAILIKQTPFDPLPSAAIAALGVHPGDGEGLNPSLVNYWMTIHPPTIFFGFSSLAVPFCYSIAALIWKDYENWTPRVMPYALLSCGVLGIGLFMGGYWAYETLGWHGFWAWDPVENASFFPWLAITALVHGLVVQKSRGGMARTNTFLGLLAFWLFLLGTFLTRSGALASKDENGQLLSVHAFDDIGKSALWLMATMLIVYGGGALLLWLARVWKMPRRSAMGDTLVSRDFALFLAVLLMLLSCAVVTLGATWPLTLSLLHRPPSAPKPLFYNKTIMPLAMLMALVMGCVPWLAWRKTNPETFLRKLLIPWFAMIVFGFLMLIWVLGAERSLHQLVSPDTEVQMQTMHAWISPSLQRVSVITLASLGFLAAISNAMLAYRVFKARKPFSAGGWLAHVGMGLLVIGIIVSNTYERTERLVLTEGEQPVQAFGYKFAFEKMTGTPLSTWPDHPDYDQHNAVEIRVTPPNGESSGSSDGSKTFLIHPRWFVYNLHTASSEQDLQRMSWPDIQKSVGHDLYVSLASDAQYEWPTDDPHQEQPGITLMPKEIRRLGSDYAIEYIGPKGEPGRYMAVQLGLATRDGKVLGLQPGILIDHGMMPVDVAIPQLMKESGQPAVIYLDRLDAATKAATLRINLPGFSGRWAVPLEVTYKPWINLVWLGVLIAVGGVFLAMIRRIGEARRLGETADIPAGSAAAPLETWETPTDGEPVAVVSSPPIAAPANNRSKNGHKSNGQGTHRKGKSGTRR
ncbi:MAG TPA: cytochrome c-type biogenesis CcmF C-terminal domain-containing protein [Chthonomonadaceae bacterium]|nr:cytochrome c-type biogenesis CcmF C-terminal domain-containing protein [Chthonomonadaceae bacterium]